MSLLKILFISIISISLAKAQTLITSFNSPQVWDQYGLTVNISGGFGEFTGTESNSSYAEFFISPINIGSADSFQIVAQLLPTNTGNGFVISVGNEINLKFASATFSTASLNTISPVLLTVAFTNIESGFNPLAIDTIRVGGLTPGGVQTLGIRLDSISVTVIPEPSSFAAFAGFAMLGTAALRRRKRVA